MRCCVQHVFDRPRLLGAPKEIYSISSIDNESGMIETKADNGFKVKIETGGVENVKDNNNQTVQQGDSQGSSKDRRSEGSHKQGCS